MPLLEALAGLPSTSQSVGAEIFCTVSSPEKQEVSLSALFVTTPSGTWFIYQGQEIGMSNVPQHWTKEDFRDEAILRYFQEIE
jgi:glycosidase